MHKGALFQMQSLGVQFRTVILFGALALSAFAQSNGSIAGTLKDTNGGVVPGATVEVANPDEGVHQTVQTNSEGDFIFPQLPPGTYRLTVEVAGFKKIEKSDV